VPSRQRLTPSRLPDKIVEATLVLVVAIHCE